MEMGVLLAAGDRTRGDSGLWAQVSVQLVELPPRKGGVLRNHAEPLSACLSRGLSQLPRRIL